MRWDVGVDPLTRTGRARRGDRSCGRAASPSSRACPSHNRWAVYASRHASAGCVWRVRSAVRVWLASRAHSLSCYRRELRCCCCCCCCCCCFARWPPCPDARAAAGADWPSRVRDVSGERTAASARFGVLRRRGYKSLSVALYLSRGATQAYEPARRSDDGCVKDELLLSEPVHVPDDGGRADDLRRTRRLQL